MPNDSMTDINLGYSPKHFVSDGDFAFWAAGYTQDNPNEWVLKVAALAPNGQPNMTTARNFLLADCPGVTDRYGDITVSQTTKLAILIGNTQRMCQGLPPISGLW